MISISTAVASLFLLVFIGRGTLVDTCDCLDIPYESVYSISKHVVKAIVTRSHKVKGKNPPLYRYKLRTLAVYKGCNPGIFKARSIIHDGLCGVVLQKGVIYKVNLGKMRRVNNFYYCYDTEAWGAVSDNERRFLKQQMRMPENKCKHSPGIRA